MLLVDTHAHIDIEEFHADREDTVKRAAQSGVAVIVNASFDLHSSRRSVSLAAKYGGVYAIVGVHPHDAAKVPEGYLDDLADLARQPGVVALGEMGLDYYRDLSPREAQKKVFRDQLALAREMEIPVVIHDRDAHGDLMDILRKDGIPEKGGIMHCYSGSWDMALECMRMGFYISIAGPVTYPNAARLKDIASRLPLDRILIETDCPYLTPQINRGKRNEPAYVKYVAIEIARLRGMPPEDLARATSENAGRIFGIKIPNYAKG
ncbi:MAG: TatD family hydrolase [Firmicutes bacterium]|nr:TatD family hydrolase [Bacillota bacterium]